MNIIRKNITFLVIMSCLVLTACGSNSTDSATQESTSTNNTTVQNDVEDNNTEETKDNFSEEITDESTTTIAQVQENDEENDEDVPLLTANDVLTYLKASCNNIGDYIEYTEETDTNQLLGRPNQYTSKINGIDTRVEQTDENDPKGFSIEVFANNEDALARQEYINSIGEKMSMLVEYNYVNEYILLRVDKSLLPSEAKEYENALNQIFQQ